MIPLHFLMNNPNVEGCEKLPLFIGACMRRMDRVYLDNSASLRTDLLWFFYFDTAKDGEQPFRLELCKQVTSFTHKNPFSMCLVENSLGIRDHKNRHN